MERDRLEYIIAAVNRTQGAINSAVGGLRQLKQAAVDATNATRAATTGLAGGLRGLGSVLIWLRGIIGTVFGLLASLLRTAIGAITSLVGAIFRLAQSIGGALWNAVSRTFGFLGGLAKWGLLGLAGATAMLAKRGIEVNLTFQAVERTLSTILKSRPAAKALISALEVEAATSMFSFRELAQFSTQLIAYGFAAKEVIPTMRVMRDVSAGLSQPGQGAETLQRLIRAFGQIRAKGIMSGEEAMQLTELGIPVRQILKIPVGKDIAAMKIPAEKAIRDLLAGLSETFGGLEAKAAGSWPVIISNIGDALDKFSKLITQGFLDRLTAASAKVLQFVSSLTQTEQGRAVVKTLTEAFNAIGDAALRFVSLFPRGVEWLANFLSSDRWEKFRQTAVNVLRWLIHVFTVVTTWLRMNWGAAWNFIRETVTSGARVIVGVVYGLIAVFEAWRTGAGGIGRMFQELKNEVVDFAIVGVRALGKFAQKAIEIMIPLGYLSVIIGSLGNVIKMLAGIALVRQIGTQARNIPEIVEGAVEGLRGIDLGGLGRKAQATFGVEPDTFARGRAAGEAAFGAWQTRMALPPTTRPSYQPGAAAGNAPASEAIPPPYYRPPEGWEPSPGALESPEGGIEVSVNVDAHLRDLPGAVGRAVERKMAQWLQTTYGTAEAIG